MVIQNKKRATALKRLFFLISLAMAIFVLAMFLTDRNLPAILTIAGFIVWFFVFQLFDFQYIEFSDENGKILLRYYPAVKFGQKEYQSIEFSQQVLHDARFEKTMFGLVTDIVFLVKTKRGVAEYPTVSLAAVSKADRKKIEQAVFRIIGE